MVHTEIEMVLKLSVHQPGFDMAHTEIELVLNLSVHQPGFDMAYTRNELDPPSPVYGWEILETASQRDFLLSCSG